MKYLDVSFDEKLYPVKIQFLSFTCEDIEVFNLATSISANRKQLPSQHCIFFDKLFTHFKGQLHSLFCENKLLLL